MQIFVLVVLCFSLFFWSNGFLEITDPVEANYVLTAKEMLESGDLFSPRIYGNYWYDKPILFYWEVILAFKTLGMGEFAARLFPSVFATLGVLITYAFGKRLYSKEVGLFGGVILATSLEYWYLSHAVITDMTLFVFMSLTLISFYMGYKEKNPLYYYGAYIFAALSVLTKGPIGLALPGLIILMFLLVEGNFREILRLKIFSGFAVFLLIVSVWYIPMYRIHGSAFVENFLGVHNVLRATVSEHPEVDVFYYYFLVFLAGFFPWVFWVMTNVIRRIYRERKLPNIDTRQKFLLVWAVTVPVVFQLMATKYITYTLPYMMPIAILFALHLKDKVTKFRFVALGSLFFYTALLIFVAAPLCEKNSGKTMAPLVNDLAKDETLMSYGKHYPASLVFYSGRTVYRLEREEDLEKFSGEREGWIKTHVMPLMEKKDLVTEKNYAVLAEKKYAKEFLREIPGVWEKKAEDSNFYLFCGKVKGGSK